jgi:hypothetical protein
MLGATAALALAASHGAEPLGGDTTTARNAATANITPVFHQLVVFTLPPRFKGGFEKTNGSFYIREHLPDGESLVKWTRMITLTGVKGLAANPSATPQGMVERMMAGFRRNCPDTYSSAVLGTHTVDGYAAFQGIASCGHVESGADAYSETAVMLAIKGSGDYYTLQWAERGTDSKQPLTLDTAYWTKQFAQLHPVRLCPIVPGESAPYPSCLGK